MKVIVAKWVAEQEFGYGRAMRVIESDHPRFAKGTRFDFGFMSIATEEGYTVISLPMGEVPNRVISAEYVDGLELRIKELSKAVAHLNCINGALREDLAAANERIRELEAKLAKRNRYADEIVAEAVAAERAISDKLEKALRSIGEFCPESSSFIAMQQLRTGANLALAKVEAMRKA